MVIDPVQARVMMYKLLLQIGEGWAIHISRKDSLTVEIHWSATGSLDQFVYKRPGKKDYSHNRGGTYATSPLIGCFVCPQKPKDEPFVQVLSFGPEGRLAE